MAQRHTISKSIEIDYGHTLPNHFSYCNQLQGHRAKVTAYVSGKICRDKGSTNEGMIMDFKILKNILIEFVHDKLDHSFVIWKNDLTDLDFIKKRNKRFLITNIPPTAECLAEWAFYQIKEKLPGEIKLIKVEWSETPTSTAIYSDQIIS